MGILDHLSLGINFRPRLAPDVGDTVTPVLPDLGLATISIREGSLYLGTSVTDFLSSPRATPQRHTFFAPPEVRGSVATSVPQLVEWIGEFSSTGDLVALRNIEETAAQEGGPATQIARQALTAGMTDFTALAERANREPRAFVALVETYLRYENPAALRTLIGRHYPGLARFTNPMDPALHFPGDQQLFMMAVYVANVLGLPLRENPFAASSHVRNREDSILSLAGVAHLLHTDPDFVLDDTNRDPAWNFLALVAGWRPTGEVREFLLGHPREVAVARERLGPYLDLLPDSFDHEVVWPDLEIVSPSPSNFLTQLTTTLTQGGTDAVQAFNDLHHRAQVARTPAEQSEVERVLREARLDNAAWSRLLAGENDLDRATTLWHSLILLGLTYENPGALELARTIDLSRFSERLRPFLRNTRNPLIASAGALVVLGNQTTGFSLEDASAFLVAAQRVLLEQFPFSEGAPIHSEPNYQAALVDGSVSGEAHRAHDLLYALRTHALRDESISLAMRRNLLGTASYLQVMGPFGASLSGMMLDEEGALYAFILEDPVLARADGGPPLVATLTRNPNRYNLLAYSLQMAEDDPALQLRFLMFCSLNRQFIVATDGDTHLRNAFSGLNAEQLYGGLAMLNGADRLRAAAALAHLWDLIPGMDHLDVTNDPLLGDRQVRASLARMEEHRSNDRSFLVAHELSTPTHVGNGRMMAYVFRAVIGELRAGARRRNLNITELHAAYSSIIESLHSQGLSLDQALELLARQGLSETFSPLLVALGHDRTGLEGVLRNSFSPLRDADGSQIRALENNLLERAYRLAVQRERRRGGSGEGTPPPATSVPLSGGFGGGGFGSPPVGNALPFGDNQAMGPGIGVALGMGNSGMGGSPLGAMGMNGSTPYSALPAGAAILFPQMGRPSTPVMSAPVASPFILAR